MDRFPESITREIVHAVSRVLDIPTDNVHRVEIDATDGMTVHAYLLNEDGSKVAHGGDAVSLKVHVPYRDH